MGKSLKKTAPQNMPKVLVLDIETAPMKAYVWRIWKENIGINQIESDWYIIAWAAKWLHKKTIFKESLPMYSTHYKRHPESDAKILHSLWDLLDQADYVITHNGNRFDLPKINSRFVYNGMTPPSVYKSVDTLAIAKTRFGFTSNKLAYIAKFLGVGEKINTGGFELWSRCLDGNPKAWHDMVKYNIRDIVILEDVYLKLRPWTTAHPNYALYVDDINPRCTVCGSDKLKCNGYAYTTVGKFKRYRCKDCGKSLRGRKSILGKDKKGTLLTNAL